MPWFRLDDSFHSHPKVIAAGNEAIGLFVRCGTYAAQHLTDGFIPEHIALLYGAAEIRSRGDAATDGTETLAETLVRTRLWRRTRKGWRMPDYLDYNPSKEAVDKERKAAAERQRRRRDGLVSRRDYHRDSHDPDPARPDPNNGSVLTDGARASPPARNPKPVSSMTNGRQPPPVAEAIARALHPEDHPRGRHAKENP